MKVTLLAVTLLAEYKLLIHMRSCISYFVFFFFLNQKNYISLAFTKIYAPQEIKNHYIKVFTILTFLIYKNYITNALKMAKMN